MTPIEMAAACVAALNGPEPAVVNLTVPVGSKLPGFPRGLLLNEMEREGVVERTSQFNAEKVLEWLVLNHLVQVEIEGNHIKITDLSGQGVTKEGGAT